jgi:long-chain acyl-CoA synthetase
VREEEQLVGQTASPPAFTNLAELIGHHGATRARAVALVEPHPRRRSVTWAELDDRVSRVAAGLAAHGLVAGHRVALLGSNSIEFVVAYFAALRAGFVCVPMDPDATDDEVRSMLTDCSARVILSATDHGISNVRRLELTEQGLDALAEDGAGVVVTSPQDREALAVLLYTAGTSGDPKAAMLTHRALLSHLEHIATFGVVDDQTTVLALLPLFHVFGLNAVLGSWAMSGATCVVLDGYTDDFFSIIADERVTNLPVAPSILYRMLQQPEIATHLTSVRTVLSGAAPLPVALATDFAERTGLRVEQGYGLTEAAPGVTVTLGGDVKGPGHVGRPLPGVQLRIGDGSDDSEPAEIWIRGDNLFSGYWPDGHGGPGQDGWFATGDIGYLSDGDLFLVDRARELIVVNGFHVYPAEVEGVIRELPGVSAVAVIGNPHRGSGERVIAFVAGSGLTEDLVLDHCVSRLPKFKRPVEVHLVDELPRGATGKVKKGLLRQMMSSP